MTFLPVTKPFNTVMRDRFFDDIFSQLTDFSSATFKNDKYPFTDIYTDHDKVVFKFALAGYSKSDIDISVDNKILNVSHEKVEDTLLKDVHYIQKNISKRGFRKSFVLGDQIDTDNVNAEMENGILTITFTKIVKPVKIISIQ